MYLIRKHKISQITNEPISGTDKEIFDFIEDKLSGLVRFENDSFPNSILYMKDGKCLFEQELKYDTLSCRYEDFWEVLISKYNVEYNDSKLFLKYMVEQTIKINIATFRRHDPTYIAWIEQKFKKLISCNI